MTEALEIAERALIEALKEISDDVEQYRTSKELKARLDQAVRDIQAGVATRLYVGRSWSEVGRLLGVTGSRAEQISRGAR